MDLEEKCDAIQTREDFVALVRAMEDDLQKNPSLWENRDLSAFLQALAGWVEDMDGYYLNQNQKPPKELTWKILGDILMAARVYE